MPTYVDVDDQDVYFAVGPSSFDSTINHTLRRVPKAGGTATVLAQALSVARIARIGDTLYWTDPKAGAVSKVAKTGGPSALVAQFTPVRVGGYGAQLLAVDTECVYVVVGLLPPAAGQPPPTPTLYRVPR